MHTLMLDLYLCMPLYVHDHLSSLLGMWEKRKIKNEAKRNTKYTFYTCPTSTCIPLHVYNYTIVHVIAYKNECALYS